jgi:hypothetical protein
MPLVHMGTAKAKSFGLFPHPCARPDPPDRLHTITRSPFARTSPKGAGDHAQPRHTVFTSGKLSHVPSPHATGHRTERWPVLFTRNSSE